MLQARQRPAFDSLRQPQPPPEITQVVGQHGDCLAAKLRSGNVHSAEDWDELLLPEIERQQAEGKQVAFRGDAAFAKPEMDIFDFMLLPRDRFYGGPEQQLEADEVCALLAAILAHGCNLGLYTMEKIAPSIPYRTLKRVSDWRLIEENQRAALANIVHGISCLDAAGCWGDGRTPASDGQRFAMPNRVLQWTYSTRFNDFALEFYSIVAFAMIGMRFCPRIRGLHRQRIYSADPARDHGVLEPVLRRGRRSVNFRLLAEQWERISHCFLAHDCPELPGSFLLLACSRLRRFVGDCAQLCSMGGQSCCP